MNIFLLALPFIIAIGIVILIRVLAGTNNGLGKVCRWFWNTSFKIASFIPFMGWMARFIIGEEREYYIRIGEKMDGIAWDGVNAAARKEKENAMRREAAQARLAQEGYSDYTVSDDGYVAIGYDSKGRKCEITFDYDND